MTIMLSSHLLSEIDQLATAVGIVSKGRLIFQDSILAMRRYAQQRVTFRVNNGERAWRVLMAAGIKGEFASDCVTLQEPSDERIALAVRTLVKEDVSIYRVEEEKRSLEDVFLQMTSKERAG